MSFSVNRVTLLGNVVADPKIFGSQGAKNIMGITVATNETWKDKGTGEKKEKSEYHRVVIFGEAIVKVLSNILKKGSKVFVDGELKTRQWEDKEGKKNFTTEVVVNFGKGQLILLDKPTDLTNTYKKSYSPAKTYEPTKSFSNDSEWDDEVPF